jgi:hypothetical protein
MSRWQPTPDGDGIPIVAVPDADYAELTDNRPPTRPIPARVVRLALLVGAVAVIIAVVAWQWEGRLITSTVTLPRPTTATVDGNGCPLDTTCDVSLGGNERPLESLQAAFPDSTVLDVTSVFDDATGRTLRSSAQVRTSAGVVVSAMAQCVRLGSAVPPRDTPSGTPGQGPADLLFVVSGAPGCSVAVAAHVPAQVTVPVASLQRVAHDPAVQLRP